MKKIWSFLRSMRFGLILLGLICLFTLISRSAENGEEQRGGALL